MASDFEMFRCTASAWRGEASQCRWCNADLPARRSRWCSDDCSYEYGRNHFWSAASSRANRRDGYRCVDCGSDGLTGNDGVELPYNRRGLEAHHLVPIQGRHAQTGCHHHLDGIVTLCKPCHLSRHDELAGRTREPKPVQIGLDVDRPRGVTWEP